MTHPDASERAREVAAGLPAPQQRAMLAIDGADVIYLGERSDGHRLRLASQIVEPLRRKGLLTRDFPLRFTELGREVRRILEERP